MYCLRACSSVEKDASKSNLKLGTFSDRDHCKVWERFRYCLKTDYLCRTKSQPTDPWSFIALAPEDHSHRLWGRRNWVADDRESGILQQKAKKWRENPNFLPFFSVLFKKSWEFAFDWNWGFFRFFFLSQKMKRKKSRQRQRLRLGFNDTRLGPTGCLYYKQSRVPKDGCVLADPGSTSTWRSYTATLQDVRIGSSTILDRWMIFQNQLLKRRNVTINFQWDDLDERLVDAVVGLAHELGLVLLAGVLDQQAAVGEESVVPVNRPLVVQLDRGSSIVCALIWN